MTSTADLFRLDNKAALVTGLGAAIAIAFAHAGAFISTHGNRRPADETTAAILQTGRDSSAFSAYLSSISGAKSIVSQARARFGKIDILVNHAGTIHRDNAVDTTLESWQQVLQVNLTSVFQLSQLLARNTIASRRSFSLRLRTAFQPAGPQDQSKGRPKINPKGAP